MMRLYLVLGWLLLILTQVSAQDAPSKKLIEFGWHSPTPSELRENIVQMEQTPFNGVSVNLSVGPMVFTTEAYPENAFEQDRDDLASTAFTRFTDNFITIWCTMQAEWRWTNPDHWDAFSQNIRNVARTAAMGGFKGLLLDAETYGESPWRYTPERFDGMSLDEARALVRGGGANFIQIVQEELPDVQILSIWLMSYVHAIQPYEDEAEMLDNNYLLFPAFIEGMFEGARGNTQIIDGNESSYYYTSATEFDAERDWLLSAVDLLSADVQAQANQRLSVGHAIYMDGQLDLWDSPRFFGYYLQNDAERLMLLEHNVYHALRSSDEYVWVYSENVNWWTGDIPQGAEQAIRDAQERNEQGLPLGFDIMQMVETASTAFERRVNIWGELVTENGDVIVGGAVLSGVTSESGDESACVVYNLNQFECVFPSGWSGEIVPILEGYRFSPERFVVTNMEQNEVVDFIGTPIDD